MPYLQILQNILWPSYSTSSPLPLPLPLPLLPPSPSYDLYVPSLLYIFTPVSTIYWTRYGYLYIHNIVYLARISLGFRRTCHYAIRVLHWVSVLLSRGSLRGGWKGGKGWRCRWGHTHSDPRLYGCKSGSWCWFAKWNSLDVVVYLAVLLNN